MDPIFHEYFSVTDRTQREKIFIKLQTSAPGYETVSHLRQLRYQQHKPFEDRFIHAILQLLYLADSFVPAHRSEKALKEIQIAEEKLALPQYHLASDLEKDFFLLEYENSIRLFSQLSLKDDHYSRGLFGFYRLSDSQIKNKLTNDLQKAFQTAPRLVHHEELFLPLAGLAHQVCEKAP